jgi:hypothetical protein
MLVGEGGPEYIIRPNSRGFTATWENDKGDVYGKLISHDQMQGLCRYV